MTHPADKVFHTLELAQHIVHHLEERDLFAALRTTRALWESKEPVSEWRRHIRRFGYVDRLIDQYTHRYHPRDIYLRICRTVDAISREATPTCTLKDLREKDSDNILVRMGKQDIQYLFRQREEDEIEIHTLDQEGMHLLYSREAIWPISCFDNSLRILGYEDDELVIRNIKDWTLSGSLGPYNARAEWWTQDQHVLSFYKIQEGEEEKTIFEVWDAHGVKRGELVHPEDGWRVDDAEKLGENLMATMGERLIKVWDLESLQCVYDYAAPEDRPHCLLSMHQNVVFYTPRIGLWFTDFWTTDGSSVTRPRAEAVTRAQQAWCKFSDGTMVTYAWELMLYDTEGAELFTEDFSSVTDEGYTMEAGILFDRFFFTVFKLIDYEPADTVIKPAELTIYSKEGDKLGSQILRKGDRTYDWFVDIFGRLVLVYKTSNDLVEELEVVDFCNWELVVDRGGD
ncbi:hypothetical protein ACHAPT_009584 [Fusarium lateritium]